MYFSLNKECEALIPSPGRKGGKIKKRDDKTEKKREKRRTFVVEMDKAAIGEPHPFREKGEKEGEIQSSNGGEGALLTLEK